MTPFRIIAALAITASVSACATAPVSRNVPFEPLPQAEALSAPDGYRPAAMQPDNKGLMPLMALLPNPEQDVVAPQAPDGPTALYKMVDYEIKVPQALTVSEANLFYPMADIVWRGDAFGNRKAQIGAIFQESVARARKTVTEGKGVKAEIELVQFHSLTEKARYAIGGVHSIQFYLTLRDAETGAIVVNRKKIKADLNGFGGRQAMEAERQGHTMKERIQSHLGRVIAAELTQPGGWQQQDEKLNKAINQI